MGTLFNQPERKSYRIDENRLEDFMSLIYLIMKKYDTNLENAIKIIEVYEFRRRNELMLSDSDIKDEQLAGFGELFQQLIEAVGSLKE